VRICVWQIPAKLEDCDDSSKKVNLKMVAEMKNELILVNIDNEQIGTATKDTVHKSAMLHRAFSVFIFNENKMLLQRRNANKYHSGGLWTNACCSHPRNGETLVDSVESRLLEELGITCPVQEYFSFIYYSQYGAELFEYEFDHVFIGDYHGKINFNPEEIEEIAWVEISRLKEWMQKEPGQFSTWFLIAAPQAIKIASAVSNE